MFKTKTKTITYKLFKVHFLTVLSNILIALVKLKLTCFFIKKSEIKVAFFKCGFH